MKTFKTKLIRSFNEPDIVKEKFLFLLRNSVFSRLYTYTNGSYRGPIPVLDQTRKSYRDLATFLVTNVTSRLYDEEKGYFRSALSYKYSYSRLPCDIYELIARTFIGATYLLADDNRPELATPFRESIRRGTDPKSPLYWGKLTHQRIVENASLTVGLMFHRQIFWEMFSEKEKQNIISYIKETAELEVYFNNWMWFKLMHFLFLEKFEGSDQQANIRGLYGKISSLHHGNGWYNDRGSSNNYAFDEYNGCTYHYYGPLFCLLADDRYDDIKEKIKSHLRIFCDNDQHLFSSNALPVFWGRSMVHRFANLACFAMGVKLGVIEQQNYPVVKAKMSGTINAFIQGGSLDHRGFLSPGYLKPIPKMLEDYCGIGSAYWALKVFSVLLLEESHPFWKQSESSGLDNKLTKKIVVDSIPMYVENDPSNENYMINGGVFTTRWDKRKYNAFAYSNTFPIVLDKTYVSNAFIFLHGGKKKIRDNIVPSKVVNDTIFHIEWYVSSIDGFKALTTMIPVDNGYCMVHRIQSPKKLDFIYSGFALPEKRLLEKTVQNDSIEFYGNDYITHLTVLAGQYTKFGFKNLPASKCVINKETIVPWCRSSLKPGMNTVVVCARAAGKERFSPMEVTKKDDWVDIRKPGGKILRIIKKADNYYYSDLSNAKKEK